MTTQTQYAMEVLRAIAKIDTRTVTVESCKAVAAKAVREIESLAAAEPEQPVACSVVLPGRVIDALWQAVGLSSYHPDGSQLMKLHNFAHAVTAEVMSRLPSSPQVREQQDKVPELQPVATGIVEAFWSASPNTVRLTFQTTKQAEAFYDRVRQAFRAAPSPENKA